MPVVAHAGEEAVYILAPLLVILLFRWLGHLRQQRKPPDHSSPPEPPQGP